MWIIIQFGLPILVGSSGIPLYLDEIPPNRFFGYRTDATLQSSEAWYSANHSLGLALIIAGLASLVVTAGLTIFDLGYRRERQAIIAISIDGGLTVLAIILTALRVNNIL